MDAPRIHIVGGGLAGLAAAVHLRGFGPQVTVYEAAPRAGGRCRSFHDSVLGTVIDNGNHLLLSGNRDVARYLADIGAADRLVGTSSTGFAFCDVRSGLRWQVSPGMVPWWIFDRRRRVPETRPAEYWSIVRLLRASHAATVADCIGDGPLVQRFWEPLTLAVLNAPPAEASAALMQAVLRETVARGAEACRPLLARDSLADTLIDPALDTLDRAGVRVRLGARVDALRAADGAIAALAVGGEEIALAPGDLAILATPAWIAADLVPGLATPPAGAPIVNVHYRLPAAGPTGAHPQILGIVGGLAQWVFRRGDIASVTISGATREADMDAADLAARCWQDVAAALNLPAAPVPPARVIKERRATPDQSPAAVALRPGPVPALRNLLLAGDWTDTGVPATIEGAVRSGFRAAALAAARLAQGGPAHGDLRGAA